MGAYYFDSSALVKRYTQEVGSPWVIRLTDAQAGNEVFTALITGKAPVLVCTGGWLPWYPGARPEGEILAERAVVLGVPRGHRLVTDTVAHTADEARAVARHLQDRLSTTAQAQVILVTSALHMRRSRVRCARAGFQVVPFPVDFRVSAGRACTLLDLRPTANSLRKTEIALRAMR